ncbi:hypothetical protein Tco_1423159 [Tanacetum coccineum]
MKDNLLRLVKNAVKKERHSSQDVVPALISQEFIAHEPKIIKELFRIHMRNTILNVNPTTSTSTATTFYLQQQLYLKMKSNLQSQVVDPKLWNALKARFEKSSALINSCMYDAFRKCDHDDHLGDDAPQEGEKSAKRQKTSKSSKSARGSSSKQPAKESNTSSSEQPRLQYFDAWVEIPVIDEDGVILKFETPELLNEFQNVGKRVPTIFDHKRIDTTIKDMLSIQFKDAKEYVYHLG